MEFYAIYVVSYFFQISSRAILIRFLFLTRGPLKIGGRRATSGPRVTSLTTPVVEL